MNMMTEIDIMNNFDEYNDYDTNDVDGEGDGLDEIDRGGKSDGDGLDEESGNESDSSCKSIDRHLFKTINMVKSLSFDHYMCVICLLRNSDKLNDEPVTINHVCETCKYYAHDSCFSVWYGINNKCIMCRRGIDTYKYDNDGGMPPPSSPDEQTFVGMMEHQNISTVGSGVSSFVVTGGMFGYLSHRAQKCINITYLICFVWLCSIFVTGCDNPKIDNLAEKTQ